MRRPRRQAERVQALDQFVNLVVADIEDDQLLVGREPDAIGPNLFGQVGHLRQDGPRHPPGDRRDSHGVQPVLQALNPDVVDRVQHRVRGGSVDQRPLQVLGLEHLPEFLDTPVLDQELQPGLGA